MTALKFSEIYTKKYGMNLDSDKPRVQAALKKAKEHFARLSHFFAEMPEAPPEEWLIHADKEAKQVQLYLQLAKAFQDAKKSNDQV